MQKGDSIPEFEALNEKGEKFKSKELLGNPAVIYFYPKDETYGCKTQACEFRDRFSEFRNIDAKVVGISGDSAESHADFAKHHDLPFTLLADEDNELRKLFDVKGNFFNLFPGRETFVFDASGILIDKFRSKFQWKEHVGKALEILNKTGD